jgi:threonine dehydrogenase-like Zn-dependent dehydrogenase
VSSGTMKAFVITAPSAGEVQTIDRWEPNEGEVLVRSKAAAICTLDRRLYRGNDGHYPAIGGHELAGIVEWSNERQTALRPGDLVAVDVMNRCGKCFYCAKGSDNICVNLSVPRRDSPYFISGGGFAEYVPIPARQAIKLPQEVNIEAATLVEPLACCLRSVERGQLAAGETAAVLGAGTMGTLHVLLAKLRGARTIVTDPDEERLSFIKCRGADHCVNPATRDAAQFVKDLTDGRGADVVFVTASKREAGEQALSMVARTGRVVYYSSVRPSVRLEFDWNEVHYREVTITGSANNSARNFAEAANLVSSAAIDLQPLVSQVIGLEGLCEELKTHPVGKQQRVVVRL